VWPLFSRARALYCRTFTGTLDIPQEAKAALMALNPAGYVGNAATQAREVAAHVKALRQ
jgi:hypothetical protein